METLRWVEIRTSPRCRQRFFIADDEITNLDPSPDGRNKALIRTFILAVIALISDSPINGSGGSYKPMRCYASELKRITSKGLVAYLREQSELADTFVNTQTLDQLPSTGPFDNRMKNTPIFDEYLQWYRTHDATLARYIYTYLMFGRKLDIDTPDLEAIALRDWFEIEDGLSKLKFDHKLMDGLRQFMSRMVSLPEAVAEPKFGPGAVSEPDIRGVAAKASSLSFNDKLLRVLESPIETMGRRKDLGYCASLYRSISAESSKSQCNVSTLRLVPKSFKSYRTICMEPNAYMFVQQLVLNRLLKGMNQSAITREIIDIHDQSVSRDLAKQASIDGCSDTLDLSSASDLVHVDLIRAIMPTRVKHALLATRTSRVQTPKGIIDVKKFAPMGSALCFPVESLTFACICLYATAVYWEGGTPGDYIDPESPFLAKPELIMRLFSDRRLGDERLRPMRVYGDDIIVDHRLTPYVTALLTELGFKINKAKSFTGSQAFRESCGGYYLRGVDMSPLFFRCKRTRTSNLTGEAYTSLVALANHAGDRGYFNLQRFAIRMLQFSGTVDNAPRPVHFSSDREAGHVFSKNVHPPKRCRYNRDYQRDEYQVITVLPARVKKCPKSLLNDLENYLYMRWSVTAGLRDDLDFVQIQDRRSTSGTRLARRWVPVP